MMTFDVPGILNSHSPTPKAGDAWHAQMPGQTELLTVEVLQVTTLTIQVRNLLDPIGTSRPVRYEHGVVKFVEKCK